ncbi:secreted RxLR effector peptide protein, putative [Phytophthora infestans T30-4]|uniref:Secreted RxLR effector peptide protein, putative n=1 Tax=Phytophthora infestans (strain T30-4) TaxID=403677 RepID=D0NPC4_PHYIT|nr:secreted RxLR effector peptide protein, putative [Phytophthora infestans T30-4]EEY62466.1 secreted RxLR effector peptide protein, putative [Phytophthora infestans T30-4]|eukprot:XP_002899102.1 secreted RxLR effector peptide protein, putative [Phytophthora infestans T30-4]
MRLAAFVLVAVAFAIIPDGRVSAAALGPPESSEGTHETARLLRLNAVPQPVETGNQEERTINFASIKKIVPGIAPLKTHKHLRRLKRQH